MHTHSIPPPTQNYFSLVKLVLSSMSIVWQSLFQWYMPHEGTDITNNNNILTNTLLPVMLYPVKSAQLLELLHLNVLPGFYSRQTYKCCKNNVSCSRFCGKWKTKTQYERSTGGFAAAVEVKNWRESGASCQAASHIPHPSAMLQYRTHDQGLGALTHEHCR